MQGFTEWNQRAQTPEGVLCLQEIHMEGRLCELSLFLCYGLELQLEGRELYIFCVCYPWCVWAFRLLAMEGWHAHPIIGRGGKKAGAGRRGEKERVRSSTMTASLLLTNPLFLLFRVVVEGKKMPSDSGWQGDITPRRNSKATLCLSRNCQEKSMFFL